MFRKILIANRGEIAVRIIRTCRAMGIPTVAVFSEADRTALHVRLADEAVAIGPPAAAESYLSIERVLDAARTTRADAIHPGYGFLSENSAFAKACQEAGIAFIGPPSSAMELMGSKTAARDVMQQAGVPVVPGSSNIRTPEDALVFAGQLGYPLMIKASAGGGGKGMRLVASADELPTAWERAGSEALSAFGDATVYIEKAIPRPRHVEVQVLADAHGNIVHLGERECSLQRRHQKVVEESPSPLFAERPEIREALCDAAIQAARAAGYINAGTVEFLADQEGNFFFLEMNTRLQVEHPVTELVTGIDLVSEQIHVAAGEPLRFAQSDIRFFGSAVECRVYAEDPANNFLPSPGRITTLREPAGPGIRIDSAAYPGWEVPLHYDPLIAKLCAWGPTRNDALNRLRAALAEYQVTGIQTTLGFFRDIIDDPAFRAGDLDTGFIGRFLGDERSAVDASANEAVVAALFALSEESSQAPAAQPQRQDSAWRSAARAKMVRPR
ncbi:MAG: acetyl-CoA carboxylase biotin carboxylase subunit [Acidobacteria bacterium]|nr:acetyl-CoA carboxylase biotin carboxylase subunit [Acidobacteriota bacterium]MDA1236572.1 acetyl-CoA carboxylase biotin carboxylase subunit [Acidobacteriota bacterium]